MKDLVDYVRIKVRFNEVDSIRMVWHGNYVAYLEDGREQFGRKYGLSYNGMFNAGLTAPIVDVHIKYHSSATVDDDLVVETRYVPCRGAKVIFDYNIYRIESGMTDECAFDINEKSHRLVISARTIQLWMRGDIFEVSSPDFYQNWKEKNDVVVR